jgi:hypothetical protein
MSLCVASPHELNALRWSAEWTRTAERPPRTISRVQFNAHKRSRRTPVYIEWNTHKNRTRRHITVIIVHNKYTYAIERTVNPPVFLSIACPVVPVPFPLCSAFMGACLSQPIQHTVQLPEGLETGHTHTHTHTHRQIYTHMHTYTHSTDRQERDKWEQ